MSNPLQNQPKDGRATDEEKILRALDIFAAIIRTIFRVVGRRKTDKQ